MSKRCAVVVAIALVSDGRAIAAFRACALACGSIWAVVQPRFAVTIARIVIGASHVMTAVFLLSVC
jgi:hypothetical protein